MKQMKWSEEQKQFLADHVAGTSMADLTVMINQHFNMNLPESTVTSAVKRYGLKNGRNTCFKKGITPHNKGKKVSPEIYEILSKSFFKKGNIPANFREQWSERITEDGYIEIKTEVHQKKWKLKHRWVWEQIHGPVPKGYSLKFKDGNKLNCSIENLMLMSKRECLTMNRHGLMTNNPDLIETSLNVAKLINLKKDKERKKNGRIQESS